MADFDPAFRNIINAEKGLANHPLDRGGMTKWGITHETLAKWRKSPVAEAEIENLSLMEARDIYKAWYWNPLGLDMAKSQPISEMVFNFGVNFGVIPMAKILQSCLGVTEDGQVGPVTLHAMNSLDPKVILRSLFCEIQLRYAAIVENDETQVVFLKGWMNRTHTFLPYL